MKINKPTHRLTCIFHFRLYINYSSDISSSLEKLNSSSRTGLDELVTAIYGEYRHSIQEVQTRIIRHFQVIFKRMNQSIQQVYDVWCRYRSWRRNDVFNRVYIHIFPMLAIWSILINNINIHLTFNIKYNRK